MPALAPLCSLHTPAATTAPRCPAHPATLFPVHLPSHSPSILAASFSSTALSPRAWPPPVLCATTWGAPWVQTSGAVQALSWWPCTIMQPWQVHARW